MHDATPGFYLNVIQFLWLLSVTAFMFLRKPGEDAGKHLEELQSTITRQDQINAAALAEQHAKVALLEERLRNMPTHTDVRALFEAMADVRGKLESMRDNQGRQNRTLELIQDFMNKSR
jgi:hypothetical protein